MTEDEVVGWHHRLEGHEFEQGLGVCDGQGSLAFSLSLSPLPAVFDVALISYFKLCICLIAY